MWLFLLLGSTAATIWLGRVAIDAEAGDLLCEQLRRMKDFVPLRRSFFFCKREIFLCSSSVYLQRVYACFVMTSNLL